MGRTAIVIPCFNEADRLDLSAFAAAIDERDDRRFVFVDDGSDDATPAALEDLRAPHPERVTVIRLGRNGGKGEAVRRGMTRALEDSADLVAYADADLSAPLPEVDRLLNRLAADRGLDAVLGTRFRRLGADIRRSEVRHYVGRVYATCASVALGTAIYDTQCGAKAFRAGPRLEVALARPFAERWAFDVELLGRLARLSGPDAWGAVVEEPLLVWHAKPGSKLSLWASMRATAELVRIGWRHRRAIRAGNPALATGPPGRP